MSLSSICHAARPVLHPVTQEAPEDASSITALLSSSLSRSRADEIGQPDHANVRQLLWQCLGNVPEVAEPRSRIMVPLAIRFVQYAYVCVCVVFVYMYMVFLCVYMGVYVCVCVCVCL